MFSLIVTTLCSVGSAAAQDGVRPAKPAEDAAKSRALTEDLRYRHWIIGVGGGMWIPSASFVPSGVGLTPPAVGGEARLRVGVGLNGYLVGFAEGNFARAAGQSGCVSCDAMSVSAGLGVAAHLTQGFAVDPWISYGAGYRATIVSVDSVARAVSDAPVHGIDFVRLAIGVEHAPVPWLGVGPYVGTDIGVRLFDGAVYGDFVVGMRVTFDVMRRDAKLTIDSAR